MRTGRRLQVGRDVVVVEEHDDGVRLEGRVRLWPGAIVWLAPSRTSLHLADRRLAVRAWRVWRLGSGAPIYRGECVWIGPLREGATPHR